MTDRSTSTREEIRIGQLAIRYLVEGKASRGTVAVFEFDVPSGAKVPIAHSHDGYEETIYGLEGVLTFTVDGRKKEIGPGDALCIPRGVVHRFDNPHSADTKTLAIVSPGHPHPGVLSRNRHIAKAAATSVPPAPPDPVAIAEVMRRHGLTPAL